MRRSGWPNGNGVGLLHPLQKAATSWPRFKRDWNIAKSRKKIMEDIRPKRIGNCRGKENMSSFESSPFLQNCLKEPAWSNVWSLMQGWWLSDDRCVCKFDSCS
ncbi:hypothetical protein TNCV_2530191 [Trichonephila clavipes]|nr:hypothetical protein TNCV_2530191 [Trichonephila clavipes]